MVLLEKVCRRKALLRAAELELSKPQTEAIIHHWFQQNYCKAQLNHQMSPFFHYWLSHHPRMQSSPTLNLIKRWYYTVSEISSEVNQDWGRKQSLLRSVQCTDSGHSNISKRSSFFILKNLTNLAGWCPHLQKPDIQTVHCTCYHPLFYLCLRYSTSQKYGHTF